MDAAWMGSIFSGEPVVQGMALASAAVQPLTESQVAFWPQLLKVLAVLCGILGLLILIQQWGKKICLPHRGRLPLIQVLDTHYLGPKRTLLLVEVGSNRFLLANTGDGLNLLAPLPGLELEKPGPLGRLSTPSSPLTAPEDKGG